jgi:hypothetical protein
MNLRYPGDKDFIFTIYDDTDVSTLNSIKPVYDTLYELGLRTTKTVWPLSFEGESDDKGSHTLEDVAYSEYIKKLSDRGFEISFHGASMVSRTREEIKHALKLFYELLGYYPRSYAPHSMNRDNLHWGASRFTIPLFKKLYMIISKETANYYQGHVEGSNHFWGDLSLKHIDYVRNFTYNEINLLNISQKLFYFNKSQPFVKSWFITCDADNVEEFNRILCAKNIEKLEKERGVCILSTHFGKGFTKNNRLNSRTNEVLQRIAQKNGWVAPVSDVLDFLRKNQKRVRIRNRELFALEAKWFIHSFFRKRRALDYDKTEVAYLFPKNQLEHKL